MKVKTKTAKTKSGIILKGKEGKSEKILKKKKKKLGSDPKVLKGEKKLKNDGMKLKKKKASVEETPTKKSKTKTSTGVKKKGGKRTKVAPVYTPIKKKQNRKQQMEHLIELVNLPDVLPKIEFSERDEKKVAKAFMDAIEKQIAGHLVPGGSGQFQFTNLFKIVTKHVPAKPKRKGINPFTKQEQVFAAKPATTRVKARPMKRLKDMALPA
jgi:hypothetical protein